MDNMIYVIRNEDGEPIGTENQELDQICNEDYYDSFDDNDYNEPIVFSDQAERFVFC